MLEVIGKVDGGSDTFLSVYIYSENEVYDYDINAIEECGNVIKVYTDYGVLYVYEDGIVKMELARNC